MVPWLKTLNIQVWQPDFNPWNLHGRIEEPISKSCPLTSTYMSHGHLYPYTCIIYMNTIIISKLRVLLSIYNVPNSVQDVEAPPMNKQTSFCWCGPHILVAIVTAFYKSGHQDSEKIPHLVKLTWSPFWLSTAVLTDSLDHNTEEIWWEFW